MKDLIVGQAARQEEDHKQNKGYKQLIVSNKIMKYGKSSAKKEVRQQIQRFDLTIHDIQLANQMMMEGFYLNIQSSRTTKSWESQTFKSKLNSSWSIVVDSPVLQLKLFARINKNFQIVSCANLHEGNQIIHLTNSLQKNKQIGKLKYELINKNNNKKQPHQQIISKITTNPIAFEKFPQTQNQNQQSFVQSLEKIIFERDSEYEEMSNLTFKKADIFGDNKSPQTKMFEKNDDEKHVFEGYLDDSSSFIEDLINIIPSHQNTIIQTHHELEKVTEKNQSQEEYTTAEKWYIKKFHLNKKLLSKKSQNRKNSNNLKLKQQVEQVKYLNSNFEKDEVLRQLSDINFSRDSNFKQVMFSVELDNGQVCEVCCLKRKDQESSSSWSSCVNLPLNGTVFVQCHNLNCNVSGCLGSDEIQSGLCLLYNQEGNQTSKLTFKCKSVSNFNVQTHSMLKFNEISVTKGLSFQGGKSSFQGSPINEKPLLKLFQQSCNTNGEYMEAQFSSSFLRTSNISKNNSKEKHDQQYDFGSVLEQEISTFRRHEKEMKINQKEDDVYSDAETKKECVLHQQKESQLLQQKISKQKSLVKDKLELKKRINKIKMKQFSEFVQEGNKVELVSNKVSGFDFEKSEIAPVNQKIQMSSPIQFPKTAQVLKKQSVKIDKLELESLVADGFDHSVSHGIDFVTRTPREDNTMSRNINEFSRKRHSTIEAQQFSPRNLMYENVYYFHQELQNERKIRGKVVSFKVCSISVSLHRSNYNSKAAKIYIDNNVYFTESSNHSHFLTWNSNGYFFLDVPKSSVLYIDIIQDMKGFNNMIGRCKVHLHCLNLTETQEVMIYDDFIRTENEESIGRVLLNYELISRRGKSLNLKNFEKQKMLYEASQGRNQHQSRVSTLMNKNKNKNKSQGNGKILFQMKQSKIDTRSISGNSLYFQEQIIERLKLQRMRKRKYTGGNIVIAKANRFKQSGVIKYTNEPGPGSYDIGSSFDRHSQHYQK